MSVLSASTILRPEYLH